MFRLLSITFFFSFFQFSFGQNDTYFSLLNIGTEWNTTNSGPRDASWSNTLYCTNTDTLINNNKYRILKRTIDMLGEDKTHLYYLREDSSRKTFLNKDNVEYILYDFNALEGDTIWRGGDLPGSENIYYYVNKIEFVEIDGSSRKQFHIISNWVSPSGNKDWTWIEGIGDSKFGILGFSAPDIGYAYKLCNVTKENKTIYPTNGSNCGLRIDQNKIKFVPNPAFNYVSLYSVEEIEFNLYDIYGRLRLKKPAGETKLDISNLEKGLYFTVLHISKDLKIRRSFVKL